MVLKLHLPTSSAASSPYPSRILEGKIIHCIRQHSKSRNSTALPITIAECLLYPTPDSELGRVVTPSVGAALQHIGVHVI